MSEPERMAVAAGFERDNAADLARLCELEAAESMASADPAAHDRITKENAKLVADAKKPFVRGSARAN